MILNRADIRRVVAILTERAGDLIVATPALRNLRTSLADARVTLVCPPAVRPVLEGWDAVDEIFAFDPLAEPDERLRLVRVLRARRFDLSIALTSNWPAYELSRAVHAPVRAGVVYGRNVVPSLLARLFLTHPLRVWIREPAAGGTLVAHRAEELLTLNAALGLDHTPLSFELPLATADRKKARARLARLGVSRPIVMHLAVRWLQENWTPRDVVGVAEALRRQAGDALLLTAGPSDARCASVFRNDGRFIVVEDLDFREWAALLEQSSIVVTHDTSAVHVASALGRPVVALYEARRFVVQSQHWAPWMVPNRVLRKGMPSTTADAISDAVESLRREVAAV